MYVQKTNFSMLKNNKKLNEKDTCTQIKQQHKIEMSIVF